MTGICLSLAECRRNTRCLYVLEQEDLRIAKRRLGVYKPRGMMINSLSESMNLFSSAPCQKWPLDQKEVYK